MGDYTDLVCNYFHYFGIGEDMHGRDQTAIDLQQKIRVKPELAFEIWPSSLKRTARNLCGHHLVANLGVYQISKVDHCGPLG